MTAALPDPATDASTGCYHCGEALVPGLRFSATINGQEQPMCCPGCAAVATMIDAGGLSGFYRQRSAFSQRPVDAKLEQDADYAVYDDDTLAATFCADLPDGQRTASILVDGITCAACTWLIENALCQVPGVSRAVVNLHDSRLDIDWQPAQLRVSDLFVHLSRLGYSPKPYIAAGRREELRVQRRDALKRLAVAGLGMMQVGMFAIALHAGDLQGIAERYQALLRWVSLPVAAFVVAYSARGFFSNAWRHLRHGALVMDLPIALAIGLAFAASVWATVTGTGAVYFDSVVMFTFFLLLGRYLEQGARQRYLGHWSDTEASLPAAVSVRMDGAWSVKPRVKLAADDIVLVKPGEVVPTDAVVTRGQSDVREDAFTGESLPRAVAPGDAIYAGTINTGQPLEARVSGDYRESRLALLLRSVQTAQGARPALATLADRVAGYFVGAILLVATVTAVAWLQIDPDKALWVTLSVLVISCPCALALATPAALTAAAGALRDRGIIVNAENALETLVRTTHLVFDKTGTLTEGDLSIDTVLPVGSLCEKDVIQLASALQQQSAHPVARAFAPVGSQLDVHEVVHCQGAGVEARHEGAAVRMGSEAFCRQIAPQLSPPPDKPLYWVALVRADEPLAWIGFSDRLRDDAPAVVDAARDRGLTVQLLTGDGSAQAAHVARALKIEDVHAGCSPQQKLAHVQALQEEGAVVCMVGDGLNDAPVLSAADVSIAVAGATELARTQASLVITDGGLHRVEEAQQIARQAYRVMRQNIAWALGYNACAIPLAAAGMVAPWVAALGMSASSLLVVLNALRLSRSAGG